MSVVRDYWNALFQEKDYKEKAFYPGENYAPFPAQIAFFEDCSPTKLARCGNRSAKTSTTTRDLAWKLMRKHPYRPEWFCATDEEYLAQKPKEFWVCAPDLTFITNIIWGKFLATYLPAWYYTNDDLVVMSQTEKKDGIEFIHAVTFRNGDVLRFRTYSQNLLSKMGASVDEIMLDEPPGSLTILTELVMRVLDKNGGLTLGFTPIDVPTEIIDYVENNVSLSEHRWSLMDNPVFRDNPETLKRALDEMRHLPEHKRKLRLYGDWDIEENEEDLVFSNVHPVEVDDFEVPANWRRVRVADPAGHRTGYTIYAEDPNTYEWFCILAVEIEWKGHTATATQIEEAMDRYAPAPDYRYFGSLYDNAENWFAAHAKHTQGQWIPCMGKKKEVTNTITREALAQGRVKFFANKARLAVIQLRRAKRKDNGEANFKKLHVADTVRYFCRQIPEPDPNWVGDKRTELERMNDAHYAKLKQTWENAGPNTLSQVRLPHRSDYQRRRR